MATPSTDDLFPDARNPQGTIVINEKCLLRTDSGHRVVVVCGMVMANYVLEDMMSEAYAMVNLVEHGWADQNDVARAFGCSTRTVRRHQRRFEEGGLAALGLSQGFPAGRSRQQPSRTQWIHRLKSQSHSNREIARRLGVNERAIRKALRRMGWKQPSLQPDLLPLEESSADVPKPSGGLASTCPAPTSAEGADPKLSAFATASAVAISADLDPTDRCADRLLARLGLLQDAPPVFGSGKDIPRAGVLLALPALVQTQVFACAQQVYHHLGAAFYGLRTSLLTLLLMGLWRIKRPEGLKEHSPQSLGRVLGLDRAPEGLDLRRKLTQLAAAGGATCFGRALAQARVTQRGQALGFLYVDGHVRAYHGQHRLPKAHVARVRLAMPATSDYWINDKEGDPLFVVTAEANAGMVTMLRRLLPEIRGLVGQRPVTFVFDRAGYSPKLFQEILAAGFDLLTYRKGRYPRIGQRCFTPHTTRQDGRRITYHLADQEVRLLKGQLRLRQITRLMENGHQTPILTSRRDVSAALLAYRMFERWRQENFFKYLREEYALDALAEHAVEPADPTRQVPNPARTALEVQLRHVQAEMERYQAEYGLEALVNSEPHRATMRGFKIAHGKLGQKIRRLFEQLSALRAKRDKLPRRVPVQSLHTEPVVKLAPERKHLTNLLKMVAYQAESELFRAVHPHYCRAQDEGRTLIQSALLSAADLEVTQDELRVTLAPLSSPHRTRAIAALCQELNQTNTLFPGSSLRLRFGIRSET